MFLNLFRKAADLTRLEQELERKDARIEKLEAEVARLGDQRERIILRYADQVSRQVKLPERFAKEAEKPEKDDPIRVFTADDLMKFDHYAREMKEQDEAMGIYYPLEDYIERVKADPDQVFVE